MKTVVQKIPLLKWPVSGLLMMLLIFAPLSALAQNTPIDNVGNAKPSAASTAEMKKDADVVMVFVIGSSSYTVNGELMVMDVSPTIIEGRTLLPIRFAATPLGAEVGWNEADRKVTVALGATEIELWIGPEQCAGKWKYGPHRCRQSQCKTSDLKRPHHAAPAICN